MDEVINVSRSGSPWQGMTGSHDEEQRGLAVAAVRMGPELERVAHLRGHVLDGEPLLAIDRQGRRVVVNQEAFGALDRPDATRLAAAERKVLGTVKSAALLARPRALVRFLVEAELIRTYVHIESELRLVDEKDEPGSYRASLQGHHTYFTSKQHRPALHFSVEIDKTTGEITVVGG